MRLNFLKGLPTDPGHLTEWLDKPPGSIASFNCHFIVAASRRHL